METQDASTTDNQDLSVADLLNRGDTAPPEQTNEEEGRQEGRTEGLPEVAPSLKDRVAELGFADVADDNDAVSRLIDAFSQERETKAQAEENYRQQVEMLKLQLQLAQQKPEQQVQQQTQTGWWNPPKLNHQQAQQYVSGRDENGAVQWKPNTPPQLIADYEAERAYQNQWAEQLVNDPVNALAGFRQEIIAEVKREYEQFYRQQAESQRVNSYVDSMIKEHEDVFYQKDPITKQVRLDHTRQPMLSEAGVRFSSIMGELEQSGITNQELLWKYALQSYKAQYGDLKQQAASKIDQARSGRTQAQAANHIPQRNGSEVNGRMSGRPDQQTFAGRMFADSPVLSRIDFN